MVREYIKKVVYLFLIFFSTFNLNIRRQQKYTRSTLFMRFHVDKRPLSLGEKALFFPLCNLVSLLN